MTVNSMTGFARTQGSLDGWSWWWEVRSVNAKGLDVRLRYPSGWDAVDQPAREAAAKRFKRGNLSASLTVERAVTGAAVTVNRELLGQLVAIAVDLKKEHGDALEVPRLDGLLAVRGVLEQAEEDDSEEAKTAREAAVLASFAEALDALSVARSEEGAKLDAVLNGHLDTIAELADKARGLAAVRPEALRERLRRQVADLLEVSNLAEDRLLQEAALLATKADVREELDRLDAHVAAARALMAAAEPVGRRYDFLCQEFNREANTLCSKSQDSELTAVGLELKTVIDQLREQVQNIE